MWKFPVNITQSFFPPFIHNVELAYIVFTIGNNSKQINI